ncbi:MAG TPA: ABC transporter ATP-binding protein [Coriobacteriia bacterium]
MSEKAKRVKDALYGPAEAGTATSGAGPVTAAGEATPAAETTRPNAARPQAAPAAARAVIEGDSGVAPGAEGDRSIVHCHDLTRRYRLGKTNFVDALRGATLDIRRGEMAAIMGPSGSGKSTLMHIVGCLDQPTSGEVWINGRRSDGLSGRALVAFRRAEIGFIFQGFNLIPTLSALENVAIASEYGGKSRGEAARHAAGLLELVGLADRKRHVPSELSGGQQQRVAIARALVNGPSIILGDEPTGDLDTATSSEIVAMMHRINADTGTTFVLVTHNPEVAASCDRTITMRDGIVEDDGC